MGNKGVRVVGIFGILIIVLVMVINIPINTQPDPQKSNCELFANDGSCAKFEYDTIITENLNSIIDAETVFTSVDENTDLSLGSEKMILVTRSVLLDSNQVIVSNSTSSIDFVPAVLLDLNKNVLDLGSVQLTFDILYKKNANILLDGEVEVFLDDQSKGKRYLSYSGQLPTNMIRLNVDKESKLLSDRTKTLTFTLADEGKEWTDGSIHNLVIKIKSMKVQIVTNGQIQKFEFSKDFPIYTLEMTVDQSKQVTFDENHNAISVFKSDGVIDVCASAINRLIHPNGQYGLLQSPTPKIQVYSGSDIIGSLESFPHSEPTEKTCKIIKNIPRNSNIKFIVNDQTINYLTSVSRPEIKFDCYSDSFVYDRFVLGVYRWDSVCSSDIGYSHRNHNVVNIFN